MFDLGGAGFADPRVGDGLQRPILGGVLVLRFTAPKNIVTPEDIVDMDIPRHEKIGRLTSLGEHYARADESRHNNTPFNLMLLSNRFYEKAFALMREANRDRMTPNGQDHRGEEF